MSFAQQSLRVRDTTLDVAAEPVLVLVCLAETVQLGGCLPPRAVDLCLGLRGRALGFGGEVAVVGRGQRGVVRLEHRLLRPRARGLRGLQLGAQWTLGSCAASASRSARSSMRRASSSDRSRRSVSTATRADTGCCGVRGSSGISSGNGSAFPRRSRHTAMPSSRTTTRCRRISSSFRSPASSAAMTESRSAADVMSASAASTCSWRNVASAPISSTRARFGFSALRVAARS